MTWREQQLLLIDLKQSKQDYGSTQQSFSSKKKKRIKHKRLPEQHYFKVRFCSLFRYAKTFDIFLLLIGLIFSMIHGAMFPVLALVFGQMTNVFIEDAKGENTSYSSNNTDSTQSGLNHPLSHSEFIEYLAECSYKYLYIGLAVLFAAFVQTLCWEFSCERQVHQLRRAAFTQMLRQDMTWYDTRQNTNLTNILSDDVERIREGIGCKLSIVSQYLSTFVCGILVGFAVNWKLTAVLTIIAPVLIGATAYLAKLTASSAAREQIKYGEAGAVAAEALNCVRIVAAFGKEPQEILRYNQALERGRRMAMKKYTVLAWGLTVVFFLMYAQYAVAFYYGAQLIHRGYCTPGSVFTVFFSVLSGAFTLGNALPYVNSVATAFGSATSIFAIIDRVPPIDPYSKTGTKPSAIRGHIEFKDVKFFYPSRPDVQVLQGLNLDIKPGKTVAFVGPSGCGKSTIVRLLLRFYEAQYGQVLLDGREVKELNLSWLRAQVGLVSQEPVLFSGTIAQNISYGREGVTHDEIEMAATMANAHAFIDALPQGYHTKVGENGAQLSGGQKQRIAIARALVRDPAVLLLDEATSALDAHSESVVQEALERAMLGRTTIIIAHRLSTVRNADLIYTLNRGRVVEQGRHDQLMDMRGHYFQLVNTQQVFNPDEGYLTDYVFSGADSGGSQLLRPRRRLTSSAISLHEFVEDPFPEGEPRKVGLRTLVRMHTPECGWLGLGIVGACLSGAVMPVFAFFYGEVFASFTKTGDELERAAVFWSCMFVVLGILAAVGIWLEVVTMTEAVERLVKRLRSIAFRNILSQPVGWFDLTEHSSGRLTARLARDAPLIKGAAGLRLGQLMSVSVTLVAALSVAFVFGWKLALVLLLVVPLVSAGAYHQTAMVRNTQLRDTTLMDEAGRTASEGVQNIRTVQAFGLESLFVRLYMDCLRKPYREAKKQAVCYSLVYAISQAVIYVMYAAAFRFGAYLIEIGDMTSTEVYRVFFALAFCAASVGTSSAYVQDFNKAKIAAKQMFVLIDRRSEINPLSRTGLKPEIVGLVRFNNVFFHYPMRADVPVFRGVTLTVTPGQTLAVVGQSGCGKSTFLSLLQRFYSPTSGSVMVDGINVEEMNIHHLRAQIGLVTQEPVLFDRSIRENIAYGLSEEELQADVMAKVIRAAMLANCHSFIVQLPQGYDTKVGAGGSQLSGGQKQRIAIARALVRNPKILLLDEATSALDSTSEKLVQDALDNARAGRTCIVVAHRLSTIQNADVIAVLDQGKIREIGTHEQLRRERGLYYKLIKAQHV